MNLTELKSIIPNSESWTQSTLIEYGWSGEEKYIILSNNKKFLLRLLSPKQYYQQAEGIQLLKTCAKILPNIPRLINHGETLNHNYYLLLTYIDGNNGMEEICKYSNDKQYSMGIRMGETIKKLHDSCTLKMNEEYKNILITKIYNSLNFYKLNKKKLLPLEDVEYQITNLKEIINERPLTVLHNDFHLGNMIINNGQISLIDFNRATLGDPFKEFDGIAWSVKYSAPFATGILDEYLKNKNIDEFFKIFRQYLALWQIQMMQFVEDQNDDEKREVLDLIQFTNGWFNVHSFIPNWFLTHSKLKAAIPKITQIKKTP